jgi:hypothetical protein
LPCHRLYNNRISKYEGGLVTLGLEAGRDILPSRVKFKEESLAIVHMADSAGLCECCANTHTHTHTHTHKCTHTHPPTHTHTHTHTHTKVRRTRHAS